MRELRSQLIDAIHDPEIQDVLADLAHMAGLGLQHYRGNDYSVFLLIQDVMNRDSKLISSKFLPPNSVLLRKMDHLEGHPFYSVCRELKNGQGLEIYGGGTLLSFLKKHFTAIRPKTTRKSAVKVNSWSPIIRQRRANDVRETPSDSWNTDTR